MKHRVRRNVKRSLAALLAAILVSNSGIVSLADSDSKWRNISADKQSMSVATDSDADRESDYDDVELATDSEVEEELYGVRYYVSPEELSEHVKVDGPDEIKAGRSLKFSVKVDEGYAVEAVLANGQEQEGGKGLFGLGSSYQYRVKDVEEDQEIEIRLSAENELTIEVDGVTISVTEKDAGALKHVASVVASVEELDEDVKNQIAADLGENRVIADYVSYDITLLDENGEEIQPEGEVQVSVSGLDTEAEYDEIEIYHLAEKMMPKRAAYALNDEAVGSAYEVEKVGTQNGDALEEKGEIRFVADAFSPYVVVFVSDTENLKIEVVLKDMHNGTTLESSKFADTLYQSVKWEDEDGDPQSLNIENMVFGYDVAEIQPETIDGIANGSEEKFAYQYATFSDDSGAEPEEKITKDDLMGQDSFTLYLWYENLKDMNIPVIAHFVTYTPAGEITTEYTFSTGAQSPFGTDPRENIALPGGTIEDHVDEIIETLNTRIPINELSEFRFVQANIKEKSALNNGWREEVTGISKDGGHVHARTVNGEIITLDEETEQRIHLFFVKGLTITMEISNAGDGTEGNKVLGQQIEGSTSDNPVTKIEAAVNNSDMTIPIEIAPGYDVVITDEKANNPDDINSRLLQFHQNKASSNAHSISV